MSTTNIQHSIKSYVSKWYIYTNILFVNWITTFLSRCNWYVNHRNMCNPVQLWSRSCIQTSLRSNFNTREEEVTRHSDAYLIWNKIKWHYYDIIMTLSSQWDKSGTPLLGDVQACEADTRAIWVWRSSGSTPSSSLVTELLTLSLRVRTATMQRKTIYCICELVISMTNQTSWP